MHPWEKPDFVADMEAAKAAAQARRDRGLPTGKPAAGWAFKRPPLDRRVFADVAQHARSAWRADVAHALNTFQAACLNGPGWEQDLEDFI